MNDQTATRLEQYIMIKRQNNSSYFIKYPENNAKGQLKNKGNGEMDFEVAGSGVHHITDDETITMDQAGCCITVGPTGATGPIVITMPAVSEAKGQRFGFIRTENIGSTVTIQSQNSETISIVDYQNGSISGTSIVSATSQPIGSTIRLYSTGTEWIGCQLSNGWSSS